MADQTDDADDLRARWRSLEPSVRRELLKTGQASEPEAQWIAVYYAQQEIGPVRRKPWTALGVFALSVVAVLGLLLLAEVGRAALLVLAAIALVVAFAVGVFGWAQNQLTALNRIITVNAHVPLPRAEGATAESVPAGRREPLDVRVVPRKLIIFLGGCALVQAAFGTVALVSHAAVATIAVFGILTGLMLVLLASALVRARQDDPTMALGEDGVTIAGGRTTVPWARITGVRVFPLFPLRRHGRAHLLLLTVDDPEQLVASLTGRHARMARRSLSSYGAPVSFADQFTDTTAHAAAAAASAWTGLPVRNS
ncbi:hypothetical protein AB0J52_29300 [Spirillospora sp. NPDC049652]